MDAVEFIEERNRMCGTMSEMWGVDAAQIVKNTEEWSAAHPRKTRQSVFLEQFPNAPIYTNTHNVALDPCLVDTALRGHCPTGRGCDICRREFWMQEVEE
jgi:hypothetical protein